MNVYFISGLGADRRIFRKLELPQAWNIHHIEWIPNKTDEPLSSYCYRLAEQIDTANPFVLVGLSFGGIVAVELSKFVKPEKIILLSTVATRSELPVTIRAFKYFPIYKLVPAILIRHPNPFVRWMMGLHTPEEFELLNQIAQDTSLTFLDWALSCIASWDNTIKPANSIHIHGSADRIFPKHYNKADIIVPHGGHLMAFSKADVISNLLRENIGYI